MHHLRLRLQILGLVGPFILLGKWFFQDGAHRNLLLLLLLFRIHWSDRLLRLYWRPVIQFWNLLTHLRYWMHFLSLIFGRVPGINSVLRLDGLILQPTVLLIMLRRDPILSRSGVFRAQLTLWSNCKVRRCPFCARVPAVYSLAQWFPAAPELSFLIVLWT